MFSQNKINAVGQEETNILKKEHLTTIHFSLQYVTYEALLHICVFSKALLAVKSRYLKDSFPHTYKINEIINKTVV